MKTPSKDLFELIKSLTKSEKGYFKKCAFAYEGKNNNYIKLFDAIDKMKVYDEKLIKEKYKSDKFVTHLWSTKKYLYKLILKSLNDMRLETLEYKINEDYNSIKTLFEKGLYAQCSKRLNEAKMLCEKYELHTFLIKFLIFEKKIFNSSHFAQKSDKDLYKHHKEMITVTEKIKYSNEYQYNSSRLFKLINEKGSVKSLEELNELKKIMQLPIYKSFKYALTEEMKLSYYKAHFYYNYLKRNFENAFTYSELLLQMYKTANTKFKERPRSYLTYLNNHLEVCLLCNKFENFAMYLKEFKESIIDNDDAYRSFYILSLNHELYYLISSCQFEKAVIYINSIKNILSIYYTDSNKAIILNTYYYISYLYFILNDYSKSLDYINKVIHSRSKDELEIIYYSQILNLIIHFEMGNMLHLEYILKSTFRYLYKRNRVFKFEKIMYDYIRRAFNFNNNDSLKKSFFELRGRLIEISKDPFENAAFDYIDIISWLESKMTGKSFAEVVKGKLENPKQQKPKTKLKKLAAV